MTDSPTPPRGQATSAIARAIRSICSDGNANPHRVAVDIGGALAHAGFEICTHAEITRLRADVEALREALDEGRRAIGDHHAPNDCYATGPVTGDPYRDLVECPACSFIAMYEKAVARAALRAGRKDVR